jgi:hypothetical protein
LEKADSAIYSLVKDLGMENALRLYHIKASWGAIFQEPLSLHTSPSKFTDGVLIINVDSPVWLQQINFYKTNIIKKLSRFGVKDIRLKLGRVNDQADRIKKDQHAQSVHHEITDEADISFIEDVVSSIKDTELRESIIQAIRKGLRRRHGSTQGCNP